jgi:type II secretory pathway pseudopilin PulG
MAILIALSSLGLAAQTLQSNSVAAPNRKKSAAHEAKPASKGAGDPFAAALQEALKNPELLKEFGQLIEKVQKGIQYPAPRSQGQFLAKLPESTVFYAAFPNYGESAHQAAQIFKEQLDKSTQLKAFLSKNKLDTLEPQIEKGTQKFYEFSQFLGDEVVIAGRLKGEEPTGVLAAEVKKPGLRAFLDHLNDEEFTNPSDRLRIFDPQQLAKASEKGATKGPVLLVRPDYIAIGLSVEALREFNSQIDRSGPGLTSTSLGRRLAQSYQSGANTVFGLDLHQLVGLIPATKAQDKAVLEKSGFADVSYLVAESTISATGATTRFELSFQGPRHGIASWIAGPAPMDGLDFVSNHPANVVAMILKSPAQIFDDLRDIAGESAFASLPQIESQLNVNFKQDLLAKLSGETILEMQGPPMGIPGSTQTAFHGAAPSANLGSYKLILRVTDPAGLQQTLTRLLATGGLQSGQREEDGVTINTFIFPSPSSSMEINYFFLDGYLVIASDQVTAREALKAHRNGDSLAKSARLRDSLPAGAGQNASLLMYQDVGKMLGSMMAQLPPELRQGLFGSTAMNFSPTVVAINADESAFHGVTISNNPQANMAVMLVVAAIAIPSVDRSRGAASEAAAAANVRTLNTAQIMYYSAYADKGFAPSLAALGPGATGSCAENDATAEHACLLDGVLANASCTAGKWCEKNGYKFAVRSTCLSGRCMRYAVTATPTNAEAGAKSFCSADDAVVRSHAGAALTVAVSAAECRTWKPLQ